MDRLPECAQFSSDNQPESISNMVVQQPLRSIIAAEASIGRTYG